MLQSCVKTFLQTAESGSFSAAASRLYVSRVSVMNQINALEASVGVPLFRRTSHGVVLTDAGRSFQKNARKILRMSEDAIREAREAGRPETVTIRVGASMMRPAARLVELWEGMENDRRNVQFSIISFHDGIDGLKNMLHGLGDTIDCFVSPCGSVKLLMEYGFCPFGSCRVEIAMSRKHPLAKKKILRWEDLENESLMLLNRGESYVLDGLRDEILRDHPKIRIVDFNGYYDISAFNLCEQKGYIMETLDIWENLHPSLVTVPVEWPYKMPYGLLYAKNPSAAVKNLVDAVHEYVSR